MANLTKEERQKRELEEKAKIEKEVELRLRAELSPDNELKKENDELKVQLEKLKKMIQNTQKEQAELSINKNINADTNNETEQDVDMNARISITSITTGGVNLKTSNDGLAKHFRLERLGQTIPIVHEHLINCINTDRWLFEEGLVYINNAMVVKEQYLEEFYPKFLTADKIQHILDFDVDTIGNMVSATTTAIQETIATLVADKINKGEIVDMNKVEIIGKSCKPEIDIRNLANNLR